MITVECLIKVKSWSFLVFIAICSMCVALHLKDDAVRSGSNKVHVRKLEGSPHTIIRKSMDWLTAEFACQKLFGTSLAILPDKKSAITLAEAIQRISVWNNTAKDLWTAIQKYEWALDRRYWIGLNNAYAKPAEWYWRNGDGVPEVGGNWYPGQADQQIVLDKPVEKKKGSPASKRRGRRAAPAPPPPPPEHCVSLWNPGFYAGELHSFNDEPCMKQYYPVCENPSP